MIEITLYEAFDGKRFDDEDDCLTYEARKNSSLIKNMVCFNEQLRLIPNLNILREGMNEVYYIKVTGSEYDRRELYNIMYTNSSLCVYDDNLEGLVEDYCFNEGIFYYDSTAEKWKNLEEEHRKQMEFYNSVKKAIEAN
jgi:hypothetical protein